MRIVLPSGFSVDASKFALEKGEGGLLSSLSSLSLSLLYSRERISKLRKTFRAQGFQGAEREVNFPLLPFQNIFRPGLLARIRQWGERIRLKYRNLLVLGIGGSSLGGKMVMEALSHPYENLKKDPALRIFFAGDNLDPYDLTSLLEVLSPEETAVLVISKSGTTIEPLSAMLVIVEWLGENYSQHLTCLTDPYTGSLRELALKKGLEVFPLDPAVGGRWSVLSPVGLLVASAAGFDWEGLLAGARSMDQAMEERSPEKNPAFLYAALCHLAHRQGLDEVVFMPYCKRLWWVSFWYVQLLAESLGKAYRRDGLKINTGRTPIPALGTTDMHAQTQQHQEGPRNKIITFLEVEEWEREIEIPSPSDFPPEMTRDFSGKKMSALLGAALDANGRALQDDHRPSIKITLPRLNGFSLGELIYFLEMTVAWEGELLDIDAYDQPGVESYKKYLKEWLRKKL